MATSTRPAYDPNATYDVTVETVEYRNDGSRSWLASIYRPQGSGPFPVLLSIHGGAWRNNDRLQNEPQDRYFAGSGLVVAAIDFRSSEDAPYPGSMADINYATRWLKQQASSFGGSAEALGGIGYSSGGHLVMLSAMRPRHPLYTSISLDGDGSVDAALDYVIMAWPVIDPFSRYEFAATINRPELRENGLLYFQDEATMQKANPQRMLERGESVELPPALLLQGAADMQLTPGMAEKFVSAYGKAGGVIEFGLFPGEPHGFAREAGTNTDRALALAKSFIARQLRLG